MIQDGKLNITITIDSHFTQYVAPFIIALIEQLKPYMNDLQAGSFTTQPICLQFFTSFNTPARQEALRQAIGSITSRMDVKTGRDWVAVYLAYCFFPDS